MVSKQIYCSSLGDLKAIMGISYQDRIIAKTISHSHLPSVESEKQRIESAGGIVELNSVPSGQVFLSSGSKPGIFISRSFGDTVASSIGVISLPEIEAINIDTTTKFLIFATASLWQVLTDDDAIEIVSKCNTSKEACSKLINDAICKWKILQKTYEDISCFVIFF